MLLKFEKLNCQVKRIVFIVVLIAVGVAFIRGLTDRNLTLLIVSLTATNFLISLLIALFSLRKALKFAIISLSLSLLLRLFCLSLVLFWLIKMFPVSSLLTALVFTISYAFFTALELGWLYIDTKGDFEKGTGLGGTS